LLKTPHQDPPDSGNMTVYSQMDVEEETLLCSKLENTKKLHRPGHVIFAGNRKGNKDIKCKELHTLKYSIDTESQYSI
jgi:hypothetical protein